ncbi:RNI-like protein [Massarina eburnea CBS 473.64]|uniref:RNI-like protein n=1 Tax=Massarina eburnea CBS 473.64 TaxID=1395130 RepID=A0A6A6SDR3_9PLEO|nr:RNI-like protein [Massarina eburnea CBS 473.64]
MDAPRRRSANPEVSALASQVAEILYPTMENNIGALTKYEKDIVKLRHLVMKQRQRQIRDATARNEAVNWNKRILKQGAWDPVADPLSLDGVPSLPMPVKVAEPETLEPFFQHLALGGTEESDSSIRAKVEATEIAEPYYNVKCLEFEKGVVYSDHRMDLCKMVVGPTNIGDLLESLKTNTFITHFLLGNNIIGPHGAKCIVDFLEEFPNRMDTWYLAGNCIDTASLAILVNEWTKSTSVTNIWLKRNPLLPAAAPHIFKLITQTPNLRTLDLDQTELGDKGTAELFTMLVHHVPEKPLPLRNLYLNALGIGENATKAIANYLATPSCALDSLYMGNNPMGNKAAIALADGLKKNKSLTRLSLSSVGVSDNGVIAICEVLETHPTISMLELGQNFATADLASRYNWITDRTAHALHNLILTSSTLRYVNLDSQPLTHNGLSLILSAVLSSPSLLHYSAKSIHEQSKAAAAVKAGQEHIRLLKAVRGHLAENVKRVYNGMEYDEFMASERRWLVNDKTDVRKIDSVYRNRDAGMARRGLMKLDKWWDEEDETLKTVMKGAVGPVCTKRKH